VTFMAFTMGFQAISNLEVWPDWREGATLAERQKTMLTPTFSLFIEDMLPAMMLLILVNFGIYRTTVTRNTEKGQ